LVNAAGVNILIWVIFLAAGSSLFSGTQGTNPFTKVKQTF
jgi:hypothetical protein